MRFGKLSLAVILAWLFTLPAPAEGWQEIGNVTAIEPIPGGAELRTEKAAVRVVAVNDAVVRVRVAPDGSFPGDFSWAVLPQALRAPAAVRLDDAGAAVEFSTPQLRIRIDKRPLRVTVHDTAGMVIHQDAPGMPMAWSPTGVRVWKAMPDDEHYFGLGEKGGPLDKRDQAYVMWNIDAYGWQEATDPLYKSIPFFLALRKGTAYGIFFDNSYRSSFEFGKHHRNVYSFGADGGEIDYYFIAGPHPKQVIERFTELTGRTPLPPRWALGYQQCRYSYFPEARVREVAGEFRRRKIPADVIYLDIDYQQGNAPFTINRELFPKFENMIADLEDQSFKVIAITDLHLKKEAGYKPYDEGLAKDLFIKNPDKSVYVGKVWPGDSVFPDFTWAPAREFWGTLYADFVKMGIDGFWNDMNEPAIFATPTKTMPLDTVHRVDSAEGGAPRTAEHREVHNVLGMQNARATYEGLLRLKPEERPFVLTRAAFAGSWRYAATWTGDNSSTWNHLRLAVPTLLGLGLSGYAMAGNDIGGFAGSPTADLLTRWMQVGVFTPFYRNHTNKGTKDQEPWVHGPEHEAIRRRYVELRYRLMPYIYTVAEEASRTGIPMMRPLFLEYPDQEQVYCAPTGCDNQYPVENVFLFGSDLLIAPRLDEGAQPYEVQLPKGDWYDYWTGRRFSAPLQGGAKLVLDPALDVMPVFVRAGAILAQQPVVQHTGETPRGPLELRVYPGGASRGSLYWDDGHTFAYKRGDYFRQQFTCAPAPDALDIRIAPAEGSYTPWWSTVAVSVFGIEQAPRHITAAGQAVTDWTHDVHTSTLTVTVPASRAGTEIRVTF